MRLLEILIPILLSTYLLWQHPRPMWVRLLPAFTLIISLAHFAIEGYRWQMTPLYALTALLGIASLMKINGLTDWKPIASILMFVLVAVSTALPVLLPLPRIPTPSGEFGVGTLSYEMVDEARQEIYSGKDEVRRYIIQIWYPADVKLTDKRAPWMENAEIFAPAIATYIDLPSFFLDHLTLTDTPAYANAEVAVSEKLFPIIFFSHGWNGFNSQNAGQALELASRGYVVIGMQHTYGAVTTVFPDGTVAPNNPKALPARLDPNYEEIARILVDQWAGDMKDTLDFLTEANSDENSPFAGKLDLERVGAYGHSTGGGGVIQFCGTDPRCKAVLGMDPFMRPVSAEVIESGVSQPAFFMFSQAWADDTDTPSSKLFMQFIPNTVNSFGVISITGTKHFDFSDLPLFSPIAPQLGLKGPLNGARVTEIVNAYLIDFFEMTLRGKDSTLFNGDFSDFSEVKEIK